MELASVMNYAPEMLMGLFLVVLGWGFRNWANTVKETSEGVMRELSQIRQENHAQFKNVSAEFRAISAEFKTHQLVVERRVSRIEGRIVPMMQELQNEQNGNKTP